jgi:hypothetical protein
VCVFEIVLEIDGGSVTGRRFRIAHTDSGLPRGLEYDEQVVLRDADLDCRYLGRVVGFDFSLEDTYYEVQVDGALAAAVADHYTDPDVHLDTAAVIRLLQQQAARRIPA